MNLIFPFILAVISLQDINNPELQEKTVEIRGFLHQMPDGEWVLSTQPNMRSCCSGAAHQRLVVHGNIGTPPRYKAVLLRGKLVQKEDFYELNDAVIDFN